MTDTARIFATIDATWPAAERQACGPFLLRRGAGGGQRVSAATVQGDWTEADIAAAEVAMRDWGQRPLFMLRGEDAGLDADLAARGYERRDPTLAMIAPIADLPDRPGHPVIETPLRLSLLADLWDAGGIGPERRAVMDRAAMPRTCLLGRVGDRPGGAAFVSVAQGMAMLHALEILPACRRKGLGRAMTLAAAHWAARQGVDTLALLVTEANAGAIALYESMGFRRVTGYHYRAATTQGA